MFVSFSSPRESSVRGIVHRLSWMRHPWIHSNGNWMISGRIWATSKLCFSSPLFIKFKFRNAVLMSVGHLATRTICHPDIWSPLSPVTDEVPCQHTLQVMHKDKERLSQASERLPYQYCMMHNFCWISNNTSRVACIFTDIFRAVAQVSTNCRRFFLCC